MQIATTGPDAARRFVRSSLSAWNDESVVDDAVLLVSELVTRALLQGAPATTVDALVSTDAVRIEVHDCHSDSRPVRVPGRTPEPEGHGLAIIDAMAATWGVVEQDHGTTVWFVMSADRSRAR